MPLVPYKIPVIAIMEHQPRVIDVYSFDRAVRFQEFVYL